MNSFNNTEKIWLFTIAWVYGCSRLLSSTPLANRFSHRNGGSYVNGSSLVVGSSMVKNVKAGSHCNFMIFQWEPDLTFGK